MTPPDRRYPAPADGATVNTMHIFEGVAGIDIEVEDDAARIVDNITGNDLAEHIEPEELRRMAKACTQAAQHIEASRR